MLLINRKRWCGWLRDYSPRHVCIKGVKKQYPVIMWCAVFCYLIEDIKETEIATTKTLSMSGRRRLQGQLSLSMSCQFGHISPQMSPKSGSCIGIEFSSFQDSWDLFWTIGKPIHPTTSSLLPLSLTFPQLCFPAKPDGVAKVSHPWASI